MSSKSTSSPSSVVGDGVSRVVQRKVNARHAVPIQLQRLIGTQGVGGGGHNIIVVILVHLTDDLGVAHAEVVFAIVLALGKAQRKAALLLVLGVGHGKGLGGGVYAVNTQVGGGGTVGQVVTVVQVFQLTNKTFDLARRQCSVAAVMAGNKRSDASHRRVRLPS